MNKKQIIVMSLIDQRSTAILDAFSSCETPQATYSYLMDLGKKQTAFTEEEKQDEHLVKGCQSQLYLIAHLREGCLYFKAYADAFISAGLAQLLVWFYDGLTLEQVLKEPPTFLEKLNIPASLTPSRANGLYSIHLKMKQLALNFYMQESKANSH